MGDNLGNGSGAWQNETSLFQILHSLVKLLSSLSVNIAQYKIAQCPVNPTTAGVIISQISQFFITNVTIFGVQHSVCSLMLQQWFRHLD